MYFSWPPLEAALSIINIRYLKKKIGEGKKLMKIKATPISAENKLSINVCLEKIRSVVHAFASRSFRIHRIRDSTSADFGKINSGIFPAT